MLQFQCHHHLHFSNNLPFPLSLTHHHNHNHKPSLLPFLHKKPTSFSISAIPPSTSSALTFLADIITTITTDGADGPIEIPSLSSPSLLSTTDDPSFIQIASSILLTGAISFLLFRSFRRRAKRLKQTQFRSSGEKSVKEEALETLKAMGTASIQTTKGPPSPVQAFLGAISAGVISLILYKFTTIIEAGLSRQPLSEDFSARQITITVRTIINGLTYLATFIFGLNSVGLFLYSGQLALNSFTGDAAEKETENKSPDQSSLSNVSVETRTNDIELSSTNEEQSSNDAS
ncbi:uncharacterized protein LOC127086282 [Lathyrus oleraceus]|uniref:Transmembrane protein n=1 Tax=Pisum sativum TaxID=3888 RepID=A0A9D4WZ66_PEA|nr:uncharacterized protein LOC127086282 [Pisum sativum]XP_050882973.1 uncharacterized protein LOC127086282 [Pisum sativum]XP_050882974.1 uncharacterized protein LOC127086282 [Pisum sativum]KAI5411794.1 hypothetical protein KIW84_056748 [Pisum sativum]